MPLPFITLTPTFRQSTTIAFTPFTLIAMFNKCMCVHTEMRTWLVLSRVTYTFPFSPFFSLFLLVYVAILLFLWTWKKHGMRGEKERER